MQISSSYSYLAMVLPILSKTGSVYTVKIPKGCLLVGFTPSQAEQSNFTVRRMVGLPELLYHILYSPNFLRH